MTQKRDIEGLLLDPGGVAKNEKVEGRPLYIPPMNMYEFVKKSSVELKPKYNPRKAPKKPPFFR